ncbi:hypothetical protein [Mucilaginibacter gilvus]|uniref:Uncharacterized protein n=1 Tax=Mucilaginibacter gilvus TaxID=2305909 RepID=A0A444MMR0_9SPHI|nr:hypothetical protein [Mucilaginibacter gilvus]RWY50960.1 hypothetical protein EPL05_12875 [Mucilaginibacter gilvus]
MPQYKNKPEDFNLFSKKVLAKSVPLTFVAIIAGLAISYYSQGGDAGGWQAVLVYMVIIILYVVFAVWQGKKRSRAMFGSYELTIADDHFLRRQAGLADKKILFSDVDTIIETKEGYLGINGPGKGNNIFIMPYVERREEIKNFLETVKPVSLQQKKSLLLRFAPLLMLATIGAMAALYLSYNKIVVVVSGSLLTTLMAWSFYTIRTSNLIDSSIKRRSWWMLLVMLSILGIMYYKVFGGLQQ